MQATIVALYGDKPEPLRAFLLTCQDVVAEVLGPCFRAYRPDQIHGTIVGLERDEREAACLLNRNFATLRGGEATMDFGGLLAFLRNGGLIPFRVQIGGFEERDYPFFSRGARPFDRSFSLQGRSAVVMGWPVVAASHPAGAAPAAGKEVPLYAPTLARLRRGAERFGILHAYHAAAADRDNDFYFRIGVVDDPRSVDDSLAECLSGQLRRLLAAQEPVFATVGLSQVSVAFYQSAELPPATTQAFALDNPGVTDAFIRKRLSQDLEADYASSLGR